MRYLVSQNRSLFGSDKYEYLNINEALEILQTSKVWGLDTETKGSKKVSVILT